MKRVRVTRQITDYPDLELLYPLATSEGHSVINNAVANGLLQTIGCRVIQHNTLNDVDSYLFIYNDMCAQFLVVRISDLISSVQLNIVGTVSPFDVLGECPEDFPFTVENARILTSILQAVSQCIQGHLRRQYIIDELKPPPPPFDKLKALFFYQRIYFPNLTDEEFSNRINVPVQTLRNWRNKIGMSQYMLRPGVIDWDVILSTDTESKGGQKKRKRQPL